MEANNNSVSFSDTTNVLSFSTSSKHLCWTALSPIKTVCETRVDSPYIELAWRHMNMATKKNIFEEHLPAWRNARKDKRQRGQIINHLCFVTGMHRNSVGRKFRAIQMRDPSHVEGRGRRTIYTPDVTAALKEIWDVGDEGCGELLHPQIKEYVLILKRDKMWKHGAEANGETARHERAYGATTGCRVRESSWYSQRTLQQNRRL